MATVIKIANLIQKNKDKEEVADYIKENEEEWQKFVDGELKRSNEANTRSLGGQQPRTSMGDEDDSEKDYEMNMEKIMAKFSNFNAVLSQKENAASNEDDEDIEEDKEEFTRGNEEEEDKLETFL